MPKFAKSYFLFLTAAALSFGAWVAVPEARANVTGSDLQNFNPSSDGLDFVTVQSVKTLPPGLFAVGGYADYAQNPLPQAVDLSGRKFRINSAQTSLDLHVALGLTRNWEVGFSASGLLRGAISDTTLSNYFVNQGVTDLRVDTKYRLLGEKSSGVALHFTLNEPYVENDPFYGNSHAYSYALELVGEIASGRWLFAANGGYRYRKPGSTIPLSPFDPLGSEVLVAGAVSYRWEKSKWTTLGELYAGLPTSDSSRYSTGDMNSAEALLGLRYSGVQNLSLNAGLGAGILRGVASPDYRVYAGLTWYPGKFWGTEKPLQESPEDVDPSLTLAASTAPLEPQKVIELPPTAPVLTGNADNVSVFDQEPRAHRERFVVRQINFETGKDEVPKSFYPYLEKMAEYLKKDPPLVRLTIYGYTDSVGTAIRNQELSQRRAEAVKRILVERLGINAEKIVAVGYGQANPAATNDTVAGRSLNRRVEFEIER